MNFTYDALPMRVVFGIGALERIRAEVDALGLSRLLVVCSPRQQELAGRVAALLGDACVGIAADAVMHVPVPVAEDTIAKATALGADGCVTVGGGSAIGLGKAIALRSGLPVVAVPTTYSGSEMTPIWGMTESGVKTTGRDPRVLPVSVVYDAALTDALPVSISVVSGLNAMAHAVEGLYAPDANPITSLMARDGVRAIAGALPAIAADPADAGGRSAALYGAWLCGAVLGATTMSLHHKLCHTLGGTLNLPHAQTHAVVLPHALAYNQSHAPAARTALSGALGGDPDPALTIWHLSAQLGAPRSLRELGMAEADIDRVVELALANPYGNPRPITPAGITGLLRRAWAGAAPSAEEEQR